MKNLLLTAMVLLATTTSNALTSDTLIISGTVSAINEIVINPNLANKDSLNIVAGETSKNVANVDELSNNLNGYRIMMSSLNSSRLLHGVNVAYGTDYTVSYDGGSFISLTNTPVEVKNSGALTGLTSDNSMVDVAVVPFATAPAGTYSDTITISIEAL